MLLGFNEPDHQDQGNTSVDAAIAAWPRLMSTGLRLGSPAVGSDYGWLDQFTGRAKKLGYPVDFISVHFYPDLTQDDAVKRLHDHLVWVHGRYGKPIWLTEFGICHWNGGWSSDYQIQKFTAEVTAMLDQLDFVERYAWFSDFGYPLCEQSALWDDSGLTLTGRAFKNSGRSTMQ